jgi:hypothetical protein
MFKRPSQKNMFKRSLLCVVFICLAIFSFAACGSNGNSGSGSTPTTTVTPQATATSKPVQTATPAPFTVTSVDLVVNPNGIAGKACGSPVSFTYTATFHIPANTGGGTIQFQYTMNNGRSSTNASVVVAPGATSQTYSFTSSETLPSDHTYPGIAEVMVTSPNAVSSPQVQPSGTCTAQAAFAVTSINMAVSPASIAGKACGTPITVTYTATFHIAANSPGGTIQFTYTVNNGRSSPSASVTVAPGQTTTTYSFTWSGNLPADHTYPGPGGVMTSSPNVVESPLVAPTGMCS